jgi:hypothetical protein
MSRFSLTNCLLGLLILSPAVTGLAADVVPPRPVSLQTRLLERLVGTWDTQISGGSADAFSQPTSIGRITRQWVVDHKFVQELGGEHEALLTYDAAHGAYHAWYFHSNGNVWEFTGRWMGTARLTLAAALDQNQTLTRQFVLLNDNNHQCNVLWTDEDGRTGIYGTLNFTRCDPAAPENSTKDPKTAAKPKSPPPAEMKVFADEIGKWTMEATTTVGEKTTKVTGSSVVQSILGGQFLQSTTTIQGRPGESIDIIGFDAATKTYRCWPFDPNSVLSQPVTGTWDQKERTMAWKDSRAADLVTVSKKQWISRDEAKIHAVSSKPGGAVESTLDGTLTRQKDK